MTPLQPCRTYSQRSNVRIRFTQLNLTLTIQILSTSGFQYNWVSLFYGKKSTARKSFSLWLPIQCEQPINTPKVLAQRSLYWPECIVKG